MRLRLIGIAAVLTVGGCWTADDVKRTGVVWSGTYAARYDQLAVSGEVNRMIAAAINVDPQWLWHGPEA